MSVSQNYTLIVLSTGILSHVLSQKYIDFGKVHISKPQCIIIIADGPGIVNTNYPV